MTTYEKWNLILQGAVWTAMIATFAVYFFQLRAMRHSSRAQNILSLIHYLQTPDVQAARHRVWNLDPDKFVSWADEEKRAASTVGSSYVVTGILIRQGVVSREPFIQDWGLSIRHCYEVLRPYIAHMRKNSGSDYWKDFDWVYHEVGTHRLPTSPHHALQPTAGRSDV